MNKFKILENDSIQSKQILLIDDVQEKLDMFARYLRKARPNYKLIGLSDPIKAIKTIQSNNPDIILLDYEMPGINGLDLLKKIQKLHAPPPVIFLTAYPEYKEEAVKAGAVDYFVKARTSWANLVERIDLVLSERQPNEEMFTALIARYKEEIELDINGSNILPVCVELNEEGEMRELRFDHYYRDNFDLLYSLKNQLLAINDLNPRLIFNSDIPETVKIFFPNMINAILVQPLKITHNGIGIWLIFGLNSDGVIKEEMIPFFAHWAKYYEQAIEQIYTLKAKRDHAVTMLRRSVTDLTRIGLGLSQLEDQSSGLYEIRVELEQNTREINLLAGVLKPGKKEGAQRSLSEITQQIVNKNEAWAKLNGITIGYKYQLDNEDGGPLLISTEWDFVVNALVSNAIDVFLFCDVDEKKPKHVLVRIAHDNGHVVLDVFDNGHGISDQIKDKLVRQGWSTKGMHRGWGLYLSAEICRNNQVRLEFVSPVDDEWNTCFRLVFPG